MSGLAVCVGGPAGAVTVAARLLPAGADGQVWQDGSLSVAVTGLDASLEVRPDLVVAVLGHPERPGGPAAGAGPSGSPARQLAEGWTGSGTAAFDDLFGDLCGDLVGDAVVVVVDRRTGRVHVHRDVAGALPVLLLTAGGGVQVATSLPAVVASGLALHPDEQWVDDYLANRWPAPGSTPYSEVAALPPGARAVSGASDREGTAPAAWRVEGHDAVQVVPALGGYADSVERFRSAFDAAVARRLPDGEGALAVSLSGGLDSSSVLVTARAVAPRAELVAVGLRFEGGGGDERAHQVAVAEAGGARLVWVDPDEAGTPFGDDPAQVFRRLGGPPLAGNWFLHEGLVRAAAEVGAYRVLDGEDGDGVLGAGQEYLADVAAHDGLAGLRREVRAVGRLHGTSPVAMSLAGAREIARASASRRWGRATSSRAGTLLAGGYLGAVMGEAHAQWEQLPGGIGHPFLDREVLAVALGLPGHHRVRDGLTKAVLRSAMTGRLPAGVLARTDKATLAGPFRRLLLGPQWDVLQDGLTQARLRSPDISRVPWLDRHEPIGNGRLYGAFRTAMVAHWRRWLTERHVDDASGV